MLFHISAFSIIIALVFGESKSVHWRSICLCGPPTHTHIYPQSSSTNEPASSPLSHPTSQRGCRPTSPGTNPCNHIRSPTKQLRGCLVLHSTSRGRTWLAGRERDGWGWIVRAWRRLGGSCESWSVCRLLVSLWLQFKGFARASLNKETPLWHDDRRNAHDYAGPSTDVRSTKPA